MIATAQATPSSALIVPPTAATAAPPTAAPPTPLDNIRYGYVVHQSIDFGGHIVSRSGSGSMYDTLVNIQSGPRILNFSLNLVGTGPGHIRLFDRLSTDSFGYGGDPNSVSTLNFSKGKLYDFRGSYRRDRQYSDYDLLANPLIPPTSTPYIPIVDSPHRFNTVRRMTDLNLTLAPLARFSVRIDYGHIISQGPSYSTIHEGADGLLTQFWRNGTDTWSAGLDWKVDPHTTVSYDEFVMHYKGDTRWQLTGLNNVLPNGTPVALGVDLSSVWAAPCAAPFNANGTVNPTCNAFLGYSRSAPTRTLSPTEQLRFQSASIPQLKLNGRILYSGATSTLNNYNEIFNGLTSRSALRQSVVTGSARIRRINVNGDLSATWQITPKLSATNTYDFWNFRVPGTNSFSETDYTGTTLLAAPGAATTTTTTDHQFLNQKSKTDTFLFAWDATSHARLTAGFRYRSRIITNAGGEFIPIHEDWALFGAALRPTPLLRVNLNLEAMYADKSFTRISPRQMQHYIVRTTYKPHPWLTMAGTINIRESRDNVETVNHLEHNRDFSFGTSISPNERWSIDLNYSYDDVFSSTISCYASTPTPPNAGVAPAVCIAAATPFANTGYYNAPTQFVAFGLMANPFKRVHLGGGYRVSAVNGTTDAINIRQVPGSLRSQFHTPYANLAVDIAPNWSWKGDYNYYGYGEGGPSGPTLPRSFHGNVCTLAVHYAF
ncbi:hypothetical protein [Granulicella sp. dw_53]|uniref:hypothetical protein n=1 Tax=Granulicella sp. dw_53 TaxID=2719792 RepID=UPI001BD2AFC0|nr:hypothetical protein [Granulicella sp. dw_53]